MRTQARLDHTNRDFGHHSAMNTLGRVIVLFSTNEPPSALGLSRGLVHDLLGRLQ